MVGEISKGCLLVMRRSCGDPASLPMTRMKRTPMPRFAFGWADGTVGMELSTPASDPFASSVFSG